MTVTPLPKPTREERKHAKADTTDLRFPKEHFGRDAHYRAWVRLQPCALRSLECSGPVEAAHLAKGGKGLKGDDYSVVPLCKFGHHAALDAYRLDGWNEAILWRKAWELSRAWCKREHRD